MAPAVWILIISAIALVAGALSFLLGWMQDTALLKIIGSVLAAVAVIALVVAGVFALDAAFA